MASYPSQIATFLTHVNITEIIDASHPNNIQGEVVAIESTLGVDPEISTTPSPSGTFNGTSTTFASVVARLANIETGIVSDAHTQYLRKAGDSANIITPGSASVKGLVIKGAASQSANLQEWQVSGSTTPVTYIDPSGNLIGTASGNVALSTVTTAGDLIVGSGAGTVTRLGIGASGTMLTSNGTAASWATIASLQGITGSQGLQGRQGTQGVQGTQGFTGPQGIQGPQGTTGLQGNQGTQGFTGAQGIQGPQGTQGFQGTTGIQGLQGLLGNQGIAGTAAAQGIQGPQGTIGSGYTGVTSTTAATPSSSGTITLTTNLQGAFVTGDHIRAVNTTSNYFEGIVTITGGTSFAIAADYSVGSTLASNWTITITGVRGVQGTVGSQGTTGTQGLQGFGYAQLQGTTGSQGTNGLQGTTGTSGSNGTNGSQGTTGTQGASGTNGAQGTAGLQGTTGATGSSGSQGTTGTQGSSGTNGSQGIQGTTGAGYGANSTSSVVIPSTGSTSFVFPSSPALSSLFYVGEQVAAVNSTGTAILYGAVTAFGSGAGYTSMTINATASSGTAGTYTSWYVYPVGIQGTSGLQGLQGLQGTYAASYSINTKSASTDSTLTDSAAVVLMNVATANTYTIQSTTGFPTGTSLSIIQTGAGQTTINGGGTTSIQSTGATYNAPRLRTRYSAASAVYDGTTWVVFGDIY